MSIPKPWQYNYLGTQKMVLDNPGLLGTGVSLTPGAGGFGFSWRPYLELGLNDDLITRPGAGFLPYQHAFDNFLLGQWFGSHLGQLTYGQSAAFAQNFLLNFKGPNNQGTSPVITFTENIVEDGDFSDRPGPEIYIDSPHFPYFSFMPSPALGFDFYFDDPATKDPLIRLNMWEQTAPENSPLWLATKNSSVTPEFMTHPYIVIPIFEIESTAHGHMLITVGPDDSGYVSLFFQFVSDSDWKSEFFIAHSAENMSSADFGDPGYFGEFSSGHGSGKLGYGPLFGAVTEYIDSQNYSYLTINNINLDFVFW